MTLTFADLLAEHAATSLEKQWALADLVGDLDWFVDLNEGVLSFENRYQFPIQVLGTESEDDGTWLWAWANTESDIPPRLLVRANELRSLGEKEHILELTEAEIPLDEVDGAHIALVAVGVCNLGGFYRGPYDGGAVYLLLETPPPDSMSRPDTVRMASVFTELIASLPIDHRRAFTSYVKQRGFSIEPTSTGLIARSPEGPSLQIDFDAQGRMSSLKTFAGPGSDI